MSGRKLLRDDRGFTVLFFAMVLLILICAFAGLAIEVGRAYVVRAELQNIADGAALAGAREIYTTPSGNLQPMILGYTCYPCDKIKNGFLPLSRADNKRLSTADIKVGFWNFSTHTLQATTSPRGICASNPNQTCNQNTDCGPNGSCLQIYPAAVSVTIEKKGRTTNSGGVNAPFINALSVLLGGDPEEILRFNMKATAVAISGMPLEVPSDLLFPFAIGWHQKECIARNWAQAIGSTPPSFMLTGTFTSCLNSTIQRRGAWITLPSDAVSADPAKQTQLSPATNTATLFDKARQLVGTDGAVVYMPVVDDPAAVPPTPMRVRGFIGVRLTDATSTTVSGQFVPFYPLPPSTTGAIKYGGELSTPTSSVLVR